MAASKKAAVDKAAERLRKIQSLSLKERLIRAMTHPLRVEILAHMNEKEWSPRELEAELGEGLSQVSYHVKVLKDFRLIEMTRTEPRRGAVEHYYRALVRAELPSRMAKHVPKSAQPIIGNDILKKIDKDIAAAFEADTFYRNPHWHTSWTPGKVNAQGFQKIEALADEFVAKVLGVLGEAANCAAKDGEELIPIGVAALVYEAAPARAKKSPATKKRCKKKGSR